MSCAMESKRYLFIGDVNGCKFHYRIIIGVPGGASLYSLSVAWVSSLGRSRLKGVCASYLGFVMCVAELRSSF